MRTISIVKKYYNTLYYITIDQVIRKRSKRKKRPRYKTFYDNDLIKDIHFGVDFIEINSPYYISYYNDENHSINTLRYNNKNNYYHPYMITFNMDNNNTIKDIIWFDFDTHHRPNQIKTTEIKQWIADHNIIFTYENHEIPDEYKAEFKLKFL